jgi:hypothetical protein
MVSHEGPESLLRLAARADERQASHRAQLHAAVTLRVLRNGFISPSCQAVSAIADVAIAQCIAIVSRGTAKKMSRTHCEYQLSREINAVSHKGID